MIGFDSPAVREALAQQFAHIQAAFARIAEACQQALSAIAEALTPVVQRIARWFYRWYNDLRRLHLIPRQTHDTMARRKIRRYALAYVRRP